ncbi:DUF1997 domain-containing protein [Geminocystis sp.]|uniref:DUF1997 domain-containing protein n=1 Tax=Geminocystis sp. TaxID=2664100 RepID=UPI003593DD8F
MSESNIPPNNTPENFIDDSLTPEELEISPQEPVAFKTLFSGIMEMYSDEDTVANYLNDHQGWFVRCASPMKAKPFGENGYTLIIGNYGAFGYNVEPEMTVILTTPQSKHYSMYSVTNPEFNNQGYEVNYISDMYIESIPVSQASVGIEKVYHQQGKNSLPEIITKINWQLNLQVKVRFPHFIYKLPMSIIQNTGDRLLSQIVKQVSPRLSYKVQKDFHCRFDLPIPPKTARTFNPVK